MNGILENAAGNLLSAGILVVAGVVVSRIKLRSQVPKEVAAMATVSRRELEKDVDESDWQRKPVYYVALAAFLLLLAGGDWWSAREILHSAGKVNQASAIKPAMEAWGGIFIVLLMRVYVTLTSLAPLMPTWRERAPRGGGVLKSAVWSALEQSKRHNWLKLYGLVSTAFWLWAAVLVALFRHG